MGPVYAGGVGPAGHRGANKAGLAQFERDAVPGVLQLLAISRERRGHAFHRVVEEIQVVAEPGRVGGEVECGVTEVATRGAVGGEQGQHLALEIG